LTVEPRRIDRTELEGLLREVEGAVLSGSHRAADLESFQIGDRLKRIDRRGVAFDSSAYALHVQAPWRVTTGREIVVAYQDLRFPRSGLLESDFDPNDLGSTRREELLDRLFSDHADLRVESTTATDLGDLRMRLTGGFSLEVFPDTSDNDDDPEYWRLLRRDSWHVIASAHGFRILAPTS
jgi:hypothetical protein